MIECCEICMTEKLMVPVLNNPNNPDSFTHGELRCPFHSPEAMGKYEETLKKDLLELERNEFRKKYERYSLVVDE